MIFLRSVLLAAFIALLIVLSRYEPEEFTVADGRYKKVDMQGLAVSSWQGPWSCVLDTRTGLIWENKTDDEGIHDGNWTYSWFLNNQGTANNGDCYFENSRCDTEDLIRRMNSEATCGKTAWRLPSTQELLTLVDNQAMVGEAKIANDFFPHTRAGVYWTSNHGQELEQSMHLNGFGANVVNFASGATLTKPYSTAPFLRLVAHAQQ